MTTPSKLGPAVLTAFGLPFLGSLCGALCRVPFLGAANQHSLKKLARPYLLRIRHNRRGSDLRFLLRLLNPEKAIGGRTGQSQLAVALADGLGRRPCGEQEQSERHWLVGRRDPREHAFAAGFHGVISQAPTMQDPKLLLPAAFEVVGLILLVAATIR